MRGRNRQDRQADASTRGARTPTRSDRRVRRNDTRRFDHTGRREVAKLDQWKARWLLRTGYDEGRSADSHYCQDKADLLKAGTIGISKPYVWIN
jgi:hypothetical protein